MSPSRWLPFGCGTPEAAVRLLCLPHAGAGASVYRTWGAALAEHGIAACCVQPPGRESRVWEQPYRHAGPLVADLASALLCDAPEALAPPYAVFGHSMGALVAFELVRELRRRGAPQPVHLFVGGRHAPQLRATQRGMRDVTIPELAALLRELGGTPPSLLADADLLESIAPLLRADFSVNETYAYVPERPLDVPITAFPATCDPRAEPVQVAAWRAQTTREFTQHLLPGGHFAVLRHDPFVHGRIRETLAPWTVPAAPLATVG